MNRMSAVLALAIAALGFIGCAQIAPKQQEAKTAPETFGYKLNEPVVDTSVRTDLDRVNAAMAATAILSTTSETTVAVDISKLVEFQPSRKFNNDGHGYARHYKPRTKAQFVALLRDPVLARREMRVSCDVLIKQMKATRPYLPFEGCEGAAAAIENDDRYKVVPCRDEMFTRDNSLAITTANGSAFGSWHRTCLKGETVLEYEDKVIGKDQLGSTMCLNPSIPKRSRLIITTATSPDLFTASACPAGYSLAAHTWSLGLLKMSRPDLYERAKVLIDAANIRPTKQATDIKAYATDAFSRTLGGPIRRSGVPHADVIDTIIVNFLDPSTMKKNAVAGKIDQQHGVGTVYFSQDPRRFITELIFPQHYESPADSGGMRRLRIFPREWEACKLNASGAVQ